MAQSSRPMVELIGPMWDFMGMTVTPLSEGFLRRRSGALARNAVNPPSGRRRGCGTAGVLTCAGGENSRANRSSRAACGGRCGGRYDWPAAAAMRGRGCEHRRARASAAATHAETAPGRGRPRAVALPGIQLRPGIPQAHAPKPPPAASKTVVAKCTLNVTENAGPRLR